MHWLIWKDQQSNTRKENFIKARQSKIVHPRCLVVCFRILIMRISAHVNEKSHVRNLKPLFAVKILVRGNRYKEVSECFFYASLRLLLYFWCLTLVDLTFIRSFANINAGWLHIYVIFFRYGATIRSLGGVESPDEHVILTFIRTFERPIVLFI